MDTITPRLDTTDLPLKVYAAPYFTEVNVSDTLGPAIEDYLNANLPILLPPYIDPAAEAAVRNIGLLRAGDTATGAIMTQRLLPTIDAEFVPKVYVDTAVAGVDPAGVYLPLTGGTVSGNLNWTSTGTTTSRAAQDRTAQVYDVLDFGAVGNGATNDTAAVQAALTAAGSRGGGIVSIGRLICLCGDLTVPVNVTLRGDFSLPSLPLNAAGDQFVGLYTQPGQIIQIPNTVITLLGCSTIEGLLLSRAGLTAFPATNAATLDTLIGQFGGYSLATNAADVVFRNVLMIGHLVGLTVGTAGANGRILCENVRGDCLNGISISFAYDIIRLINCHFYPWLSFGVPGARPDQISRDGTAFQVASSDWPLFVGCFAYGYRRSYNLVNCTSAVFTGCHTDANGTNNDFGWFIFGNSDPVMMTGCTGNSATTMVHIEPTQSATPELVPTSVRTCGCRFAAINIGVRVLTGAYSSVNDTFESGSIAGIVAENGTQGAIIAAQFRWTGTGYTFANPATAASWDVIAPKFTGGTVAPAVTNQLNTLNLQVLEATAIAAASAMSLLSATTQTGEFRFGTTGNPADENIWDWFVSGNQMTFRTVNDAYNAGNPWLQVTRTGFEPSRIEANANEIVLDTGGAVGSLVELLADRINFAGNVEFPAGSLVMGPSGGPLSLANNVALQWLTTGAGAVQAFVDPADSFTLRGTAADGTTPRTIATMLQDSDTSALTFGVPVQLVGNAVANLQAVPLQQLNAGLANHLSTAGGTMTGALTMLGVSLDMNNGAAITSNDNFIRFSGTLFSLTTDGVNFSGPVILRDLPTSGAGLASGQVWNNGGVLNIAP